MANEFRYSDVLTHSNDIGVTPMVNQWTSWSGYEIRLPFQIKGTGL